MWGSTVDIVILLALSLLCVPLTAAEAQQAKKVFRVGLLSTTNPRSEPAFVAFAQRLQELGLVEGQNCAFEFRITRVFALWDTHTEDQLRATEDAARSLGLQLQSVELRHPPYDFAGAIGVAVRERAQALVVLSSPLFFPQRAQIVELTLKHRLPAIFLFREYVEAGGLMAYGVNRADMWRRAADYVEKILKGARPVDLPVEQPIKFELVINLKTAKALGMTMPPSLLLLADEVIQ